MKTKKKSIKKKVPKKNIASEVGIKKKKPEKGDRRGPHKK